MQTFIDSYGNYGILYEPDKSAGRKLLFVLVFMIPGAFMLGLFIALIATLACKYALENPFAVTDMIINILEYIF